MIEIERKFLVTSSEYRKSYHRKSMIIQGYLSKDPNRIVRVRIRGDQGFITIKGISTKDGLSRYEWEDEISVIKAQELMLLCLPIIIKKNRYEINFKGSLFEVDEFIGLHQGLIIAEVELNSIEDKIELPTWVGEEVTGNKNYYNSYLSSPV